MREKRDYQYLLQVYYHNCFQSPVIETKTKYEAVTSQYHEKLKRNTRFNDDEIAIRSICNENGLSKFIYNSAISYIGIPCNIKHDTLLNCFIIVSLIDASRKPNLEDYGTNWEILCSAVKQIVKFYYRKLLRIYNEKIPKLEINQTDCDLFEEIYRRSLNNSFNRIGIVKKNNITLKDYTLLGCKMLFALRKHIPLWCNNKGSSIITDAHPQYL